MIDIGDEINAYIQTIVIKKSLEVMNNSDSLKFKLTYND